jgi:2-oxoglutarate ferredoxin oxidoreductase subunit beta
MPMGEDALYTIDNVVPPNPIENLLRMDRIPHIWCPGCGIGSTVNCFVRALQTSGLDLDKVAIVSGIGCTGRVAGYIKLDSFHTTHGRAIPFATGLKLANPELKVVVYSGDGDLTAIGGNHFIHAARRNVDLTVILINNMTYGMTGGQVAPTTPLSATASTAPYGNFEQTFNLPYLAKSCGAVYVARWTAFHVRHATKSIKEALAKKGFSFVEILAACPTLYSSRNKLGDGLDQMIYFRDHSEIKHGADTQTVALDFQGKITVGKFVDIERPSYQQLMYDHLKKKLGDQYIPSPEMKNVYGKNGN